MSFSSKNNSISSKKGKISPSNTPSQGDTFFDSMHNSKFSDNPKNKIKKENNFYMALNCVLSPNQGSILLGTSEFSEFNPNQTKDENISRYLHHPIIKEINKVGNNLIRIQSKQNYDTIIKQPYISKYNNMKEIFKEMISSLKNDDFYEKDAGRKTLNYNNNKDNNFNINKNNTIHRRNCNKEINNISNDINYNNIEIEHQKNKSPIINNIIDNNKISKSKNNSNYTKNKNVNNNKSGQINSTTITKVNLGKNNKEGTTEDVKEIKKRIKYEDKLEDLEEPKDIDLKYYIDEDNKNIFLNDYNSNISSLNSNKKINIFDNDDQEEILNKENRITNRKTSKNDEIFIFDSLVNNMNIDNLNISKVREKRATTVKKLRKKYERNEFKKYIYNTNPKINRYIYEKGYNKNIESNYDLKRKLTEYFNQNIDNNINQNAIIKNNIYYNTNNKINKDENLISKQDSNNNINKNLLDNFNDCRSNQNDEFASIKNDNNKIYNDDIEIKNNSPDAEFLDFISNKSEITYKYNNTNSKINKDSNENTFIIKNSSKIESIKSLEQNENNMDYELTNSPRSEKISIRKYTSSFNQSGLLENYKTPGRNNKNMYYNYLSPNRNPDAIIRKNFSLFSSDENDIYINSYFDEIKSNCHSCINKSNHYKKDFSLICNLKSSNKSNNNSKNLLNVSSIKRNKLYIISNKDKLRDSLLNPIPETVYDLVFYQNLIENSKKARKINYKNILKNHKKIKWEDRLHTLCWMMQICEEFAFKRDTFHYACNYFDNYLTFTNEKIKNAKILELIGITCISISGKIEEVQIPKLKEYANSIDETFGIKDIIDMEQKICLTLGWKLIDININTWLNWYICQWDLYIDSVDDIKEQLLKFINEEDIIYYKKTIDNSYYNYRKISQLVDIIALDHYSYNFNSRVLMSVCLLVIICIDYNLDYNFKKKNFRQQTKFSKYIFDVYIQFLNQSFDFNFNDKTIQNALEYVYKFRNFNFNYELPLLYQIHQDMLENGNYEDFISYQTTNENLEDYLKNIFIKRNIKDSSEKTTSNTDKQKFISSQKSSLK